MSNRLLALFLEFHSGFYWFGPVVPKRRRQSVGKRKMWAWLKASEAGDVRLGDRGEPRDDPWNRFGRFH